MTFLLLNGHGINLRVDNAKLHIRDGRTSTTGEPKEYVFSPKQIDVDSVVIYGASGNISIESIRWLVKHGLQVVILNWNGKLLTTMLPPESVQVKTKFAQYRAFDDPKKRFELARKFIEAKLIGTQEVLEYLNQRYPDIDTELPVQVDQLDKAPNIREVMGIEGVVAAFYWHEIQKIIPNKLEFSSRAVGRTNRPMGASDWVNCMLNYGYSLLEAECLRAINSAGLDAHIGFLHEANPGKNSLAYDMQEPFRFIIDLAIIDLIENDKMEKKDFVRTESFTLRLKASGAQKVTQAVNKWLNKVTNYQEKEISYGYLITSKTRELVRYLTVQNVSFNVSTSVLNVKLNVKRYDSDKMRQKILNVSYAEWQKMGFSKGTLYYMKKNAKAEKPFTLNKHVRERLAMWENR
ncbi:MAG: CRISPR-associated endonuclease Cas1 [Methanoregula sp.]|jgi:CRISPR-associated protein Cas1